MKTLLLISFIFSNLLFAGSIESKDIYLEYISYPKRVFTGQKFDIVLKSTILLDEKKYNKIVTKFQGEKNIEIPEASPIWYKDKDNIFISTITFKSKIKQFTLPSISLYLMKEKKVIKKISIKLPKIEFEKIAINQELFSHILASNLEINTVKTKQYTNSVFLTTINIEATNSNLEDINLSKYKKQKIESLTENYPYQNLYYSIMIPSHTKEVIFTYYNTIIKDFIMITLPISLKEDLVSTQTDINPYSSSMLVYKQSFIIALLIIAFLIYFITRNSKHLFIIAILLSLLAYLFIPNKKIILEKGRKVYILPTTPATIFHTLKQKELVEIVSQKGKYIKILFKNQNIGWIKND